MDTPFNIHSFIEKMEGYLGHQEGPAKPFWKAFSFAVDAHQGQMRKSGEDYISHPCLVASILVEELAINDPETLAAAILHDTVEDVPEVTKELIGELFGRNVEEIVEGCTKITNFSGDKQTFYKLVHRKLFSGAASRVEVMFIKLADRLHNLRTMDSMPRHKRQKIAEETLAVYAPLAKILGLFELKRELYNLALIYKFPRQGQKIESKIQKIVVSPEVEEIKERLIKELEQTWITADIYTIPKGLWSYFDPENNVLLKQVENPMEIIISVPDIQACYRTLGVVNQLFPPIPRTIRDFIANPKPTGYQSLHARANIKGQNYLFKFRTDQMYETGKTGIVKMWLEHKKVPSDFEEDIQELFGLLSAEDGLSYTDTIAASGKKEIYTFTPKGERVCLPKQSTVLDFAFKVHTEVGLRCVAARVGNHKAGPEHVLADGDRVKIITRDKPVEFEPEMQSLCQSPKARSVLSKTFRFRRQILAREIGESILRQEMQRYTIPWEILDKSKARKLFEHFDAKNISEFVQEIGSGELRLKDAMTAIRDILYPEGALKDPAVEAYNQIFLDTLDPACIKLSRCCSPIPTQKELYGLLSERGLSVHRENCTRIRNLDLLREDVVKVVWKLKTTMVSKSQTIVVLKAASRNRVMMMLGVAPSEMQINEVILLSSLPNGTSAWEVNFRVETLQDMKNILNHFDKTGLGYEMFLEQ